MSRFATLVEIAGVSFTGCRAHIIDPEDFFSPYAGSVDWGNSGNPLAQTVNRGVKGIPFGIQFDTAEESKLLLVKAAILTAEGTNSTFVVKITEGLYTVNVNAIRDYNQKFISYDRFSEGYYENTICRFIAKSSGA